MQPVQIKMARAALDFSIDQLAAAAGIAHMDVVQLEGGGSMDDDLLGKVRAALELAGIELIDDNGVRLRGRSAATIPLEELSSANDE